MNTNDTGVLAGGHISYLFILVHDLSRMLAFYRDILGFQTLYYSEGEFAFLSLGQGPQLAFYPDRNTAVDGDASHIFLVIDVADIEAAVAGLRHRSVPVGEIFDVPYGRAAIFSDPEGNRIELHEPVREGG